MAKTTKKASKKKSNALRNSILEKLSTTFAALKETMGEKKFERKISKASKILSSGSRIKASKPAQPKKKAAKSKKADPAAKATS